MSSPVRVWPVLQEYVATELYVVVETDTIPFAGFPSVPQSTAEQGKSMQPHLTHFLVAQCTTVNSCTGNTSTFEYVAFKNAGKKTHNNRYDS